MTKIRTIIVDDEAPARARIRHLLRDESDFEVIGECANGRQAVAALQKQGPDLVFLDVQMPRLGGFEVCAAVEPEAMPLVIFVTAYDHYALKAFEVHAIDYLLKPFDRDRFQAALAHARARCQRSRETPVSEQLSALLRDLREGGVNSDRLVLKENGRMIFVRSATIDWLEADGNYVRVHVSGASHYVRETLAG